MKTKLMALALLAAGSMFAQTRFSVGVSVGGNRGSYTPAPAYVSVGSTYGSSYRSDNDRRFNDRDRDGDRYRRNSFRAHDRYDYRAHDRDDRRWR